MSSRLALIALAFLTIGACTGVNTVGSQTSTSGGGTGTTTACRNVCSSTGGASGSSGGSTTSSTTQPIATSTGAGTGATTTSSGCGSGPNAAPAGGLAFGNLAVGTISGYLTVEFNNPTCSEIWFNVDASGLDSQFGINDANGTSPADHSEPIPAGGSYSISMVFAPTAAGSDTSSFTWTACPTAADTLTGTNCFFVAQPYAVSGVGVGGGSTAGSTGGSTGSTTGSTTGSSGCGGAVNATPVGGLDFGNVAVGAISGNQTVSFNNPTCSEVWFQVFASGLEAQNFYYDDANGTSPADHPDSIPAGGSYPVSFFFSPIATGPDSATFTWIACPTEADVQAGTNCFFAAQSYSLSGVGGSAGSTGGSSGGSSGGSTGGGSCAAAAGDTCDASNGSSCCSGLFCYELHCQACGDAGAMPGTACSTGADCCGQQCVNGVCSSGSSSGAFTCGLPPNTGTVSCAQGQFCEFECYYNVPTCFDPPAVCGSNPSCDCILDAGVGLCSAIGGAQPNPPTCTEDGGNANVFCSQSC